MDPAANTDKTVGHFRLSDQARVGANPTPVSGWLVWCLRWSWLTAAAFLAGSAGQAAQTVVGLAAILQVSLTVAWLRPRPYPGLLRLGLVLDAVGPPLLLTALGSPPGPAWGLLLAPAATLSLSGAGGLGVLAVAGGLLAAGLAHSGQSGSLVGSALVTLGHALVLLPAALLVWVLAHRFLLQTGMATDGGPQTREIEAHARVALDIESADLVTASLDRGLLILAATGLVPEELAGLALAYRDDRLQEVGRSRLDPSVAPIQLDLDPDQLDDLLDRRQADGAGDLVTTDWVQRLMADVGWQSIACLPLWDQDRCLGLAVFGSQLPAALGEPQQTALTVLGQEANLALRYAALRQQLVSERDRLSEIQDDARRKLARDLHDGPTQVIAAIAMRTNFARRQVNRDPATAIAELEKVEAMARSTTKEIRHMLFTLRPLILESQGLTAALRQFADKIAETHGQTIGLELDRAVDRALLSERQGALFYVAEEAITNALKHAAAEQIALKLWLEDGDVLLQVDDDGVGFHMGQVDANYEQRGSLGLVTMRERAQLLGAQLSILSEEGVGTTIRVRLPADPSGSEPDNGNELAATVG
jgi:signal transduction histidine kinase